MNVKPKPSWKKRQDTAKLLYRDGIISSDDLSLALNPSKKNQLRVKMKKEKAINREMVGVIKHYRDLNKNGVPDGQEREVI